MFLKDIDSSREGENTWMQEVDSQRHKNNVNLSVPKSKIKCV